MLYDRKKKTEGLAVILVVIAAVIGIIGWNLPQENLKCGIPVSIIQCGTASISINQSSLTGATTVTFPTAFSSTPKIALTPKTAFNPPTGVLSLLGNFAFFNVESTGITWTSFPSGTTPTEFNNNINYRIYFPSEMEFVNSAVLTVNCVTGSTNFNAFFRAEYSLDNSNWSELASITTEGDMSVADAIITGNANGCTSGTPSLATSVHWQIAALAIRSDVFVRLTGFGGNGVGDNPVFTRASISLFSRTTTYFQYVSFSSKTSFTITVILPSLNEESAQSVSIDWIARL